MKKRFSVRFISTVTLLFACSAVPAFANRGGGGGGSHGGGGGGFHGGGGGGFHSSGGGSRPSGGSYRGAAPAYGYGGSRGSAPSYRSGGSSSAVRPGSSNSRPGGTFAGGNQRPGSSAPAAIADGQWHSFGGSSGARGASGEQSSGNFHVFSGNRGARSTGGVRSFSGQGGEVWENTPASRNVVSRSQSLSTIHNSFSASSGLNSAARPNASLSASSSLGARSALGGNRASLGSVGGVGRAQLGGSYRSGYPYGFGGRGGCWNCGFGFGRFGGWGWGGWGWPWLGFGLWDPFWFDPWWGGPGPGYGYYGYPDSSVYGYPDAGYYNPDDNSSQQPPEGSQYDQERYDQAPINGNWITPNGPSPAVAPNSSNLAVPILIYLKNGAVLNVRDYWMIDGELHYLLTSGVQRTVNLELVDLPRTNNENAKSGVRFIFKSEPSIPSPSQPDAAPGSPTQPAPAPTQELNAVPQPEART